MGILEDIVKFFELKTDPMQFFNSPLFLLLTIIIFAIIIAGFFIVRRHRRMGKKIKIKKHNGSETISDDTAEAQCKSYERQMEKEQQIHRLGRNDILVLSRDNDSVTILFNKEGSPEVKKIFFADEKTTDLTTTRRKPEYKPYQPQSKDEFISELKEGMSDETKNDIDDIEKEVDGIDVKKKPNFLSRVAMSLGEKEMKKKVETAEPSESKSHERPQLTEEDVFGDEPEPKTVEYAEQPVEQDKDDTSEGESKRQTVFKLLNKGLSKDEIVKQTGILEKTVARYQTDWNDERLRVLRGLVTDDKYGLVKKLMEILNSGETILIQNGKLYYPGRDRLTYVFIGTTIVLAFVAVYFAL
jgi:hypothetical protein